MHADVDRMQERRRPRRLRILVCASEEAAGRLNRALVGHDLTYLGSSEEALSALREGRFDLVILGMSFDEWRALEFLERLRASPALAHVPVAAIRGARRPSVINPDSFDLPARLLDARDVIDFAAIPNNPSGQEEIRRRIVAASLPRTVSEPGRNEADWTGRLRRWMRSLSRRSA
ncbi:MAG: hypothetical protein JO035_16130 [Betaproteobacteria bacterium]|nr:hypothetical protein [Betaproteobacteria bacterium]